MAQCFFIFDTTNPGINIMPVATPRHHSKVNDTVRTSRWGPAVLVSNDFENLLTGSKLDVQLAILRMSSEAVRCMLFFAPLIAYDNFVSLSPK